MGIDSHIWIVTTQFISAHLILIDIWQGPFFLFFIYSVPLSIYPLYIFTHKTNPEDIDRSYYLVTECTKCNKCKKGFVSWSPDILNQLNPGHKARFPAVLTYRPVSLK